MLVTQVTQVTRATRATQRASITADIRRRRTRATLSRRIPPGRGPRAPRPTVQGMDSPGGMAVTTPRGRRLRRDTLTCIRDDRQDLLVLHVKVATGLPRRPGAGLHPPHRGTGLRLLLLVKVVRPPQGRHLTAVMVRRDTKTVRRAPFYVFSCDRRGRVHVRDLDVQKLLFLFEPKQRSKMLLFN